MTKVLYSDEWVTVTADPASGVVKYTRNKVPFKDMGEVERCFGGVRAVLPHLPPQAKLLIDIRLAPPRNDAAFESRTGAGLQEFARRFTKMATLVATAVGKLQTKRIATEQGREAHVFHDEASAVAYLLST